MESLASRFGLYIQWKWQCCHNLSSSAVLFGRLVSMGSPLFRQVTVLCMLYGAKIALGGPFENCYQVVPCVVDDHPAGRDQWLGEGLRHAAPAGQIRLASKWAYPVRFGADADMAVYSPAWGEQVWTDGGHGFGVGLIGDCF